MIGNKAMAKLTDALVVPNYKVMPLKEIGHWICVEWPKMNYAAKPYVHAILQLNADGMYICDDWQSVVSYFLANAGTWRGERAKAIKAELNRRLDLDRMNG